MRKNIKNYTSSQAVSVTVQQIQKVLARVGAKRVMFDYHQDGELSSVAFFIDTPKGKVAVKLPARVEKVAQVMYGSQELTKKQEEQTKRTTWKNIQDWIDAQVALIETEMVKVEEVFLPYIVDPDGMSLFEIMENRSFLLPEKTIGPK